MTEFKSRLLYSIILILLTIFFYSDVPELEFLNIDDHVYVTENAYVQQGLTWESIQWAFTTFHAEFYHPLTWLSLMLDTALFGPEPFGYHLTNLLLHIASSVILFLAFSAVTGMNFRSFVLAALFALHPLHVEAVAWISERKDLLCGLFWIAAIYAYFRYVQTPSMLRYGLTAFLFLLGMLSKSMIVTFPFALLLLDIWPLRRWPKGEKTAVDLMVEKLPLFAIMATGIGATLFAQQAGGGIVGFETYSMAGRVANAIISYKAYLINTFMPINLSVFYPYRTDITALELSVALLLLGMVTLLTIFLFYKKPYLLVGWFWFLGILVPVIGIVKIGDFAMADRYMYMPVLGLLFAVVWLLADVLGQHRPVKVVSVGIAIVFIAIAGLGTQSYLQKWQDSNTLFAHAAVVAAPNYFAHYSLGQILAGKGQMAEAEIHFKAANILRPNTERLMLDLGRIIAAQGRFEESLNYFKQVIKKNQDRHEARYYMGLALLGVGKTDMAVKHLIAAIPDTKKLSEAVVNCKKHKNTNCFLQLLDIDDSYKTIQKNMAKGYQDWIDRI